MSSFSSRKYVVDLPYTKKLFPLLFTYTYELNKNELLSVKMHQLLNLILQAAHQVGRHAFIKLRRIRQAQVVHNTHKLNQSLGEAWVQSTFFQDGGVAVALVVVRRID